MINSCTYINNRITEIDLKDRFDKEDIFDAREFFGDNYFADESLILKIKTDAEIIKAENITHFYPTIWSSIDDKAIQLIYLFDIEYNDTLTLETANGFIKYHKREESLPPTIKDFYSKITKSQVMSAIEKVPQEYKRKQTWLDYERKSWLSEIKIWKRIAQGYKQNDFTDDKNEPFDVDPYEIDLVVTFRDKDSVFTKTFRSEALVGN